MNDIVEAIKKARYVFVCGNGGSSATAEHFTNDLFKKGIRAICLNSNTSIITMIANDYGYQYIFSKQLKTYANDNDVLVVFSVSGTSPNILEALNVPIGRGMVQIKFFGEPDESYGDAEDRHIKIAHEIANAL